MKQELIEYQLIVSGIKKKCRKEDRHHFKIIESTNLEQVEPTEDVKALARTILSNEMRSVRSAKIFAQHLKIEDINDGFISKSFMLFDQRNKSYSLV